jgi:hypothetical protein
MDTMNPRQRKLFSIFHALANKRFAPLVTDELRDARLGWLSLLLGRTVTSSKTLGARELKLAADQLMREVPEAIAQKYRRAAGGYRRRRDRAGETVMMPNRGVVTEQQLHMVGSLEKLLGWDTVPERLRGFLQQWYGVRDARELTFRDASRLIESLCAVAARSRVKIRLGQDHPVSREEITAEVRVIKDDLHRWHPDPPEAA